MRIIIVGAGLVGVQLARQLVEEKHDVSVIESNEERARYVSNRLDCMVLHDEGNSISVLKEAGIARADALVCVTESDEVNMIICGLAAEYKGLLKIARVRNDEYVRRNFQNIGEERSAMGIDFFIHPDVEAARSTLDAISHGAIGDIFSFAGTDYELGSIGINPGSPFDGLVLAQFRTLLEGESLVTLVERRGECILPQGTTELAAGDRIYLLAKEQVIDEGFHLAGRDEKSIRKIGIVGGGRLGSLIAAGILRGEIDDPRIRKNDKGFFSILKTFIPKNLRNVVIIEQDYGICKDLASRFPEALILNEDISDESFVAEEKIDDLDLIVTATEHQELNIITAVYLKSRGVKRAIAMVTGSGYVAIARQLGIDVVIPMKSVVVDSILSKLMGGGIRGLRHIGDGSTGILEIVISGGSQAEGKALKDFHLPEGALVMLVDPAQRSVDPDGEKTVLPADTFIPRGDYVYTAGHRILLIARNGTEMDIMKIFGKKQ
ncbi:MAG: NAD-binding protein [Treponema sp.]|nr:NAD-binding protein [Treponema sp.]